MRTYDFLLDLFPLTAQVAEEYPLLGQQLQLCGLALLESSDEVGRIDLLLRLSRDLGVLDGDVVQYLQRSLRVIVRQAGRIPPSG